MKINYNYEKAKWTDEENNRLLNEYALGTLLDEIVIPNRTNVAIKQQLVRLATEKMIIVRRRHPLWTAENDLQLIELINSGKRYKEISEITGRTQDTLRNRVMKLRRKYSQEQNFHNN